MYQEIRKKLFELSNSDLVKFNHRLCPNSEKEFLGIRVPELRKMAKKIISEEFEEILNQINMIENVYMEEILLEGFIIGYSKVNFNQKLKLVQNFIPKIDNWLVTDTFCNTLKFKDEFLEELWDFIIRYVRSNKEFEARFGIIMILNNFIKPKYVDKVIKELDKVECKEYYVQMAVAWTISEIGVKYNDKAMAYLTGNNNLDKFTYNKSLQKMIESYRITKEQKELLKSMKKK